MLFDLKGRRKRVVQITYVGLALLMGGGLVLSGIGSSASGGLLDALVGNGSSSSSSDAKKPLQKKVDAAEARLATNPKDRAALAELVRAHFGLAGLEQSDNGQTVSLSKTGQEEMVKAEQAWGRYIDTDPPQIDQGLAATVLAIYDSGAVPLPSDDKDKKSRYVRPARDLAEQANTKEAYIKLVSVATKAGDTRTAALAERKALSFAATKDDRATTKEQIAAEKQAAAPTPPAGGNGAAPPAGGP
jgi:hypothetical protein